jgi:Tfp pilus assembly protein PilN
MRPVNLLPPRYRPRTGGGADSKTSYIALGALGLVLLAVFGYVMSANKVSATNAEIAATKQKVDAANARSVTLKGFGDFAGVKEARLTAVKSLATARLDWERLFRELAHVLPERVWLTAFDGTAAPEGENDGGAETGSASSLLLNGCADDHRQIANVLVRLRELHVAEDVELTKTQGSTDDAAALAGAAASSEGGCGPYYSFEIKIALALPAPGTEADGGAIPASLGGGS